MKTCASGTWKQGLTYYKVSKSNKQPYLHPPNCCPLYFVSACKPSNNLTDCRRPPKQSPDIMSLIWMQRIWLTVSVNEHCSRGRGKENTSSISNMRCIFPHNEHEDNHKSISFWKLTLQLVVWMEYKLKLKFNPSMLHQFRLRPSGYIPTKAWSTTSSSWTSRYHTKPEVI